MRRRKQRRLLFSLVLLSAIFAAGAYAYTNTINMSAPNLGSGSDAIEGYEVSATGPVAYTLDTTDYTLLDAVGFTLTGATSLTDVHIQVETGGPWYACSSASAPAITCDTSVGTQATAAGANNLTIVANG